MERLQAVRPERAVAGLEVGAAAVELVEVEDEVDVDVSLRAGELAEPSGECGGIEGRRSDGHGDLPCVLLRSTRFSRLRRRTRTAAEAISGGAAASTPSVRSTPPVRARECARAAVSRDVHTRGAIRAGGRQAVFFTHRNWDVQS